LGLRVVCVERNGFGQTPFDPGLGVADYVDDVLDVLATLAIERFAIVAMSGGAPYAIALAARVPERVISVHLAAASSGPLPGGPTEELAAMAADLPRLAREPKSFWGYPPGSPVYRIPGFVDAAYAEGARAAFVAGQMGEPGPLRHEWGLQARPLPDVSAVAAPVYLYYGTEDALSPPAHVGVWRRAFPNVHAVRLYEGEGHDVQYRHWDQILVDLAGMGDLILICWRGKSLLVDARDAGDHLARGATLGLCAWAAPA
jgi:non-heme chloroperoxidase